MVSGRPDFLGELAGLKRCARVRFLIVRSTPWCIPIPASGSSPRPLSVAEPRRITRINTEAEDGVAYLLLPRLTLCLCSNAHFAGGL
jgi:hypothetical protein